MSNTPLDNGRRQFIKLGAIGLATVPMASLLLQRAAQAADLPQVDEKDPMAMSLGYMNDATKVDVAKYPRRAGEAGAKQFCNNCQLYSGKAGEEWGPCAIFPGRQVNAKGWCNSWVQKAS